MKINIFGPGGPGLRGHVEDIVRAINTPWLISITSYGNHYPEDTDFTEFLAEINQGKDDNQYGNVRVHVHHEPWGG